MGNANIYIVGTGSYLPATIVTNGEVSDTTGLSPEEIEKVTGIKERRRAAQDEATSDLATKAALAALDSAGIEAQDVDFIVLATTSPDMPFPSTACIVQKNINAAKAAAFDINASCSGFLYALNIAEMFLNNGQGKTALVLASEIKSRFVNPKDRETAILFGDGAGAVVLKSSNNATHKGILKTKLYAEGKNWSWIHLPAGGSRMPANYTTVNDGLHFMGMDGSKVYRIAIRTLERMVVDITKECSFTLNDIDLFIFHQANQRIVKQVIKRLGITEEKVPQSLVYYGNTSSASIPITLDQVVRERGIKEGSLVLMASFGGGLTWGASIVRW